MVHSSVGYCPCGAEIWVEYLPPPSGNQQGWQLRFFDAQNRPLENCPECQREIHEEALASR
jgi:hypothetical protein